MVNFIGNPELFIVFGVIEDGLIDKLLSKFVDDFDSVKIDKGTIRSTTWNVVDSISLNADFHFDELFNERQFEVESGLSECFLKHSKLCVDSNITFLDLMEPKKHGSGICCDTDENDVYDGGHNFCKICF